MVNISINIKRIDLCNKLKEITKRVVKIFKKNLNHQKSIIFFLLKKFDITNYV